MATINYTVENVVDNAHSAAIIDAINEIAYVSNVSVVAE